MYIFQDNENEKSDITKIQTRKYYEHLCYHHH
jgi:hypothetical protein